MVAVAPPDWPPPAGDALEVFREASGRRWACAAQLLRSLGAGDVDADDGARALDADPKRFAASNGLGGAAGPRDGWLLAPPRLDGPCAACRCLGELRAFPCRADRGHGARPFDAPPAELLGSRVKRRVVAPDGAVEWRPATVAARGDATLDLVDVAGGGVVTAAYPDAALAFVDGFRDLADEERVAGRVMEVVAAGRVARARVDRVYVCRDEGPRHDVALAVLRDAEDGGEPARERAVTVAELLRAVGGGDHVRWRDRATPPTWLVDDRTGLCGGEVEEDDEGHWWYDTRAGDTVASVAAELCGGAGDELRAANEIRLRPAAFLDGQDGDGEPAFRAHVLLLLPRAPARDAAPRRRRPCARCLLGGSLGARHCRESLRHDDPDFDDLPEDPVGASVVVKWLDDGAAVWYDAVVESFEPRGDGLALSVRYVDGGEVDDIEWPSEDAAVAPPGNRKAKRKAGALPESGAKRQA